MAKEKYKQCTNCKTVHIIHRSFKDRCPTCYKCGGTSFEGSTFNPKIKHYPIFCDWNLQHRVDEAADRVGEYLLSKHSSTIDSDLLADLKQCLVFAANSSRRDFAFSKDGFEKFNKPIK